MSPLLLPLFVFLRLFPVVHACEVEPFVFGNFEGCCSSRGHGSNKTQCLPGEAEIVPECQNMTSKCTSKRHPSSKYPSETFYNFGTSKSVRRFWATCTKIVRYSSSTPLKPSSSSESSWCLAQLRMYNEQTLINSDTFQSWRFPIFQMTC